MTDELTKGELIDRLINDHTDTMITLAIQGHTVEIKQWMRELCGYETLEFGQLLELAQGTGILTPQEEEEYDL